MDGIRAAEHWDVHMPGDASESSIAVVADRTLAAEALTLLLRSFGSNARTVSCAWETEDAVCVLLTARTLEAAGRLLGGLGLVEDRTRLVLLAGDGDRGWDALARKAHARAWLPPDASVAELGNALGIDVPTPTSHLTTGDALCALTRRERAVLLALTEGATPIEIARSLTISVHTVRTHLANAMRKLGVNSRIEAVSAVLRSCARAEQATVR